MRRTLNKKEREIVYRKCDGRCCYCGQPITFKQLQVDHYYPNCMREYYNKNYGIETEDLLNIVPACRTCNHYKRGDTPEYFKYKMQTIHERISNIYIAKVGIAYGIISVTPFDGKFYFEKIKTFGIIYPTDILSHLTCKI